MIAHRLAPYALPLLAAAIAPTIGCGGTVTAEPAASASEAMTRAPVAQNAHGRIKALGAALGQVPLTGTQRAEIEKMAADSEARHADARAAQQDFMVTLAAQVEAGSIDRTALTPKLDALSSALAKVQPDDRAALERLHAVLGPSQRAAFVDAVQAQVRERFSAMHGNHPMHQWAEDLKLTDDQRAQIKASFQQPSAVEADHEVRAGAAHMQRGAKVLEAFKQDRFVMDEVAPPMDVTQSVARMTNHLLTMAEHAVPILTVEQRTLAGQKLRERAAASEDTLP
ncbi:MAG TPA: hypothetical protein VKU41_32950 [Polyangiaceae bacterium]|nr:hypothetical protein [Polyangiaceae bacterium]